jgi:uncharacterized Zn-binding protein involved in type VI secretion
VPNIPADVVGQAGATAATATQNAANLTQSPQAHWYDVWGQTLSGVGDNMSDPQYLATHMSPAAGVIDSRIRMAQAIARPWNSAGLDSLADGMSQQAGVIADQAAQLWNGQNPNGQPMTTLQRVGAAFGLLTSIEQMATMFLGGIPFPAFPAIRVLDQDIGLPHAHMHPPNLTPPNPVPVPLPSTGPIIPIPFVSGASKTLINSMPAARCGDMGLGVFCGGFFPMYEVFFGSANVWIEGNRAGRVGVDLTKHCIFSNPANVSKLDMPIGAMFGTTINCSTNVMIGGVPVPSLTSAAIGAAFKAVFKGVGRVVAAARKRMSRAAAAADNVPPRPGHTATAPASATPPHANFPIVESPLVMQASRDIAVGGRQIIDGINIGELAALGRVTGDEWAVVVQADGRLALARGSADGSGFVFESGDHLLAHNHPPGISAEPSSPGNTGNPTGGNDTDNALHNLDEHAWDHPAATVDTDGNVIYYDHRGPISNPNDAMLPIDNAGNIDGIHTPGGNPGTGVNAIPPGMMTPGNPWRD